MTDQFKETEKENPNRKKIGLALGGGGAKGLAHIGVIKALIQAQIPIDFIAGTSMGALVGGWFAVNKSVNLLEGLFLQIKNGDIFPDEKIIKKKNGSLFKDNSIVELLEKTFKDKSINDCQIPFTAVATNVENGEQVTIKEGKISDAIRASIAIPVVFKPVKINGQLLSDGGLVNPVPADVVREMGADYVIAVDVSSRWINFNESLVKPKDYYSMLSEAFSVVGYQISKRILEKADIVLRPQVLTFDLLAFNEAKEIIERGYSEAKRNIEEICEKTGRQKQPETLLEKFFDFFIYDKE